MNTSTKKHDRKLGLGATALTQARNNRHEIPVLGEIQNELESIMIDSGYLIGAPFEWITVMLRYGLTNEEQPHYERVNRKYGDLPLAIEVDVCDIRDAERVDLKRFLMVATLKALIHAGQRYHLLTADLESKLHELDSSATD